MPNDPKIPEIKSAKPTLSVIEPYTTPSIDPALLENIRPLEKIESTLEEISSNLKEQNELLIEILNELKKK